MTHSLAAGVHISEVLMLLRLAVLFLICAVILAVLGFGVTAAAAAAIIKILFYVFLVLFMISLITHVSRHA